MYHENIVALDFAFTSVDLYQNVNLVRQVTCGKCVWHLNEIIKGLDCF